MFFLFAAARSSLCLMLERVAVIGAGPAGVAIVGNLLELPHKVGSIVWIDPLFTAGRLARYTNVPSNTKLSLFKKYAEACESFDAKQFKSKIVGADLNKGCKLGLASNMVEEISVNLINQQQNVLKAEWGYAKEILELDGGQLKVIHDGGIETLAQKVFIATGSQPKALNLHSKYGLKMIDLDTALDSEKLASEVNSSDSVVVLGSSHSAMLAVMNLCQLKNRPEVINYYRSSLKYAVDKGDYVLFDNTGLKGEVADWTRIEMKKCTNLERVQLPKDEEQFFSELLPKSSHIVYAVGYERINSLRFNGVAIQDLKYNKKNGNIVVQNVEAKNAFGFGIAFPEQTYDPEGHVEEAVGLWKFMNYIKATVPTKF